MKMELSLPNELKKLVTSLLALFLGTGAFALCNSADAASGSKPWLPWPPHHKPPPHLPEVNVSFVLVPITIAVLLFASRQIWRRRDAKNY
jgi:hypothetical protein